MTAQVLLLPNTARGLSQEIFRPTNGDNMSRSRPSSKARKLDSGFQVTSRPIPPSTSGSVTDWIAVDVENNPATVSSVSLGKQRALEVPASGKRKGMHARSFSDPSRAQTRNAGEEEAAVKDTTRIKLAYDAKGRRMVNQWVSDIPIFWFSC